MCRGACLSSCIMYTYRAPSSSSLSASYLLSELFFFVFLYTNKYIIGPASPYYLLIHVYIGDTNHLSSWGGYIYFLLSIYLILLRRYTSSSNNQQALCYIYNICYSTRNTFGMIPGVKDIHLPENRRKPILSDGGLFLLGKTMITRTFCNDHCSLKLRYSMISWMRIIDEGACPF